MQFHAKSEQMSIINKRQFSLQLHFAVHKKTRVVIQSTFLRSERSIILDSLSCVMKPTP